MSKKRNYTVFLTAVLLVVGLGTMPVSGASFNFSVTTVIPENQTDKDKTYFDLRMTPGQEQTVQVELKNDTKEDITVEADINTAGTDSDGIVNYSGNDVKKDETLRYDMRNIAETEESFVIPGKSKYTLDMKLTMPEEDFDGVLAGGLTLREVSDDSQSDGKNATYVVAILLSVNDNEVEPDIKMNEVTLNDATSLRANIQNVTPVYVNELEIYAEIYEKGGNEPVTEFDVMQRQMAPNSNFDLTIPFETGLGSGDYTLKLKGQSLLKEWEFEADFTIQPISGEGISKKMKDMNLPGEGNNIFLYVVIFLVIAGGAALGVVLFLKHKNNQKALDELKKSLRGDGKDDKQ